MNLHSGYGWLQSFRNFSTRAKKMFSKYMLLSMAVLLATSASLLILGTRAVAIDAIKVKYGAVDVSVTIPELVTFAKTGETSNQLRSLFQIAKATPEQIQRVRESLGYQVKVNPNFLNEVFNSYYGKLVLTEVSKYMTPGSDIAKTVDDVTAAVNTSLADGQLSLLELLQNYQGTNAIVIDGEQVLSIYNRLVRDGQRILAYIKSEPEMQKLLCKTS
ncbi:MAG: alpha/beta hydrolase [Actinomycetota bacterium]